MIFHPPPCWPYVELKKEAEAIRQLLEERKETNAHAVALASDLLDKKLEEMNGIKREVLQQAKEAAGVHGERKWLDILITALVSGVVAYLVSKGGP